MYSINPQRHTPPISQIISILALYNRIMPKKAKHPIIPTINLYANMTARDEVCINVGLSVRIQKNADTINNKNNGNIDLCRMDDNT